ncbi:MAG: hypothetical protein M3R24_20815 [Chloroflexota bacterium]|nr:hypothetical protein [Chloroflexota bacterium]
MADWPVSSATGRSFAYGSSLNPFISLNEMIMETPFLFIKQIAARLLTIAGGAARAVPDGV